LLVFGRNDLSIEDDIALRAGAVKGHAE